MSEQETIQAVTPGTSDADATEQGTENAKPDGGDSPAGDSRGGAPVRDPIAEAQADVARFKEQWMRTAADFDNFRKRTRREVEDARKAGAEDLLRVILPVFDNLERAIVSSQRATEIKAVADGLSMVLKQFADSLGKTGISKIESVGKPFDPQVHEAIQQVETSDHAPGTVIAEVQPGYVQGERLIRAAMVVVAKAKTDAGAKAEEPSAN